MDQPYTTRVHDDDLGIFDIEMDAQQLQHHHHPQQQQQQQPILSLSSSLSSPHYRHSSVLLKNMSAEQIKQRQLQRRIARTSPLPVVHSTSSPPTGPQIVCRFFMQGSCRKGDDCPYLHAIGGSGDRGRVGSYGSSPSHSSPHAHYARDRYFGRERDRDRDRADTGGVGSPGSINKVCKFYLQGNCRHGTDCLFLHTTGSLPAEFQQQHWHHQHRRISSLSASPKSAMSPFPLHHPPASSVVCPFWLKGDCKYGNQCRNRHSIEGSSSTATGAQQQQLWDARGNT